MRIAESIKGKAPYPKVPDSSFPSGPNDEKLDGIFDLFDFLLENDVHLGTVTINDVRHRRTEKIIQVLKALKSWEEKKTEVSKLFSSSAGLAHNSKSYLAGGSVWNPVM